MWSRRWASPSVSCSTGTPVHPDTTAAMCLGSTDNCLAWLRRFYAWRWASKLSSMSRRRAAAS